MDISDRNRNVVGIYPTAAGAQKAINDLLDLGYRTDEISVISRAIDDDRKNIEDMETLHDPSWSHGARPGGAVGGVSGLLAGLGQLEVPGMGTVMAGGPIKDYLTSRQVGGKPVGTPEATIGQVICGPDAPAGDAAFVEERFQAGDIFIRVDAAGDRLARVAEVFGQHRAHGSDPYERPELTGLDTVDETELGSLGDAVPDLTTERVDGTGDPHDSGIPADKVDESRGPRTEQEAREMLDRASSPDPKRDPGVDPKRAGGWTPAPMDPDSLSAERVEPEQDPLAQPAEPLLGKEDRTPPAEDPPTEAGQEAGSVEQEAREILEKAKNEARQNRE